MEALALLENKISELIELVNSLKEKNTTLAAEKNKLSEQLAMMEGSSKKNLELLDQEKELTKMALSGLIKNIDSLVEGAAE